mgnify:CR=1 FL=1
MMFDLIPTPAPALTSHLRAHLLAQYRADMRHDRAELANLSRMALADRSSTAVMHTSTTFQLMLPTSSEKNASVTAALRRNLRI